jgi:hypothetical protein
MFFAVLAVTPGPEPTALQAHSQASREEYGLVDHKRPYGLPQYDLMDLMVRDENVHFEEGMVGVSEGSSPEEEHQMPELNLTPLADLYIDQRASTTTSELSMRNESLLGLSAVHADGPVCPATLPHSERMLLTLHALPYHGSSALHQALMSSPKVGTMCAGNHWQCEVSLRTGAGSRCAGCQQVVSHVLGGAKRHDRTMKQTIAKWEESEHDGPSHSKGIKGAHVPLATSGLPCFACAGLAEEKHAAPCEKRSVEQRLASDMRVMEPYWMRQPNRSIMIVKWAPLTAMGGVCPLLDIKAEYMKVGRGTHDFVLTAPEIPPGEMQTFGSDVVPAGMRKAGVHKLTWATLLMHRPWCMWRASTHSEAEESSCRGSSCRGATLARGSTDKDIGQWARRELMHIEELVLQHQKLVQRGAAVLVVNLAHLVFDFKGFDSRLRAFAPCLGGKLDDAFEPQLGTDVFLSNQLKTGGSLQEYAHAHTPHNWMLDEKLACREPPEKLFEGLNETEMIRAQAAEEYLVAMASANPLSLRSAQAAVDAARLKRLQEAQEILDAVQAQHDGKIAEKEEAKEERAAEKEERQAEKARQAEEHQAEVKEKQEAVMARRAASQKNLDAVKAHKSAVKAHRAGTTEQEGGPERKVAEHAGRKEEARAAAIAKMEAHKAARAAAREARAAAKAGGRGKPAQAEKGAESKAEHQAPVFSEKQDAVQAHRAAMREQAERRVEEHRAAIKAAIKARKEKKSGP